MTISGSLPVNAPCNLRRIPGGFQTMITREDMDNLLSKQTISDLKHTERHSESDGSHVVMHFSVSSTQIS